MADVTPFVYSTAELFQSPHGALTKMRYMLRNRDVEEKLRECLRRDRYDAWIIHNTFPAMSPCVYGLALEQSVPVIHYLHNYRAGCLNGVFYSIHTRMKYLAIKKGMSLRDIVNEAMTEYLKRHDT